MSDLPTPEETLEAQLNSFRARLEQLEQDTAAEHADMGEEIDLLTERLRAQETAITHLLRLLDFLQPGFSIESFRKSLQMVDNAVLADGTVVRDPESQESWNQLIEDLLPDSLRTAHSRRSGRGTFRPTLVPKGTDDDR
ncbi:hypothetical protein BTE77_27805 [Ensifer adhaerens]|nr:hypothetical protein BTE77_27805 [Ensifer adhaerens]